MQLVNQPLVRTEVIELESALLERTVQLECFLPSHINDLSSAELLLINDGQNMQELGLASILETLYRNDAISPLVCVGIFAGDRLMEYGTAGILDYLGRGFKATLYSRFVTDELLSFIKSKFDVQKFRQQSFAGFSLGGLSALDIVWNHSDQFTKAGVFSGSLWWRTRSLDDDYDESRDRIMHSIIRNGTYVKGLKFFFEAGALDETMDRNHNGIIDAIDDTLALIDELVKIGYRAPDDIIYLELQEGRHDISTWAKAMPEFLKWGWRK